jgi:hypothetical protein
VNAQGYETSVDESTEHIEMPMSKIKTLAVP